MSYIVPRVQIEQEFEQVPIFGTQPLAALVIGPQYDLHRYSESDEKPDIFAGVYNPTAGNVFAYPNRTAGSTIDQDYVKVFFDNAEAEYFSDLIGSGSVVVNPDANLKNRIYSAGLVFKTANGTPRSAGLSNRDVQLGDVVYVSDTSISHKATVTGFVADIINASNGPVTGATSNKTDTTETLNNVPTYTGSGGAPANIVVANTTIAYEGYLSKKVLTDTYSVEVTTGGTIASGNVRFTVTSSSGVFEPKTGVQIVGGEIVIDDTGTNDVKVGVSGTGTFVVGNKWSVELVAAYATYTPTVAGTFTGDVDTSYTATVVRGGPFYTGSNADVCAQIRVSSDQVDSFGPVNVQEGVAFPLGTKGVTFTIPAGANGGRGLAFNDSFSIPITASKPGAIRTLELSSELPAALLAGAAADLNLSICIPKSGAAITKVKDLGLGTSNWSTDEFNVTLEPGIFLNDPLVLDGADLKQLPVKAANVYIEHRDLMSSNVTSISSVSTSTEVEDVLGELHPDNPIALAVYNAALNAAGVPVYFIAVGSDDLSGYNAALSYAKQLNTVYSLVPTTTDSAIQDAVIAHVNTMSTSVEAKWRICWLSLPVNETAIVLDKKTNGLNFTATVQDDPLEQNTQYTFVTIDGATLITSGIRPNDTLLINFGTDSNGKPVFEEYNIDAVRSETTLVLSTGLPSAILSGVKVEIRRNYTIDEQVNELAAKAVSYKNRRVRVVFPDSFVGSGLNQPGYFLAACLAGLRSGVVPHQGLTNIQLLGVSDVSETFTKYSDVQLNKLAENGVFIVTQLTLNATPFVRHQLTTDPSSLSTYEDSITTNVDSISYGLQSRLDPFIGRYNRNQNTVSLVKLAIERELKFRMTQTETTQAGNQILSYDIVNIRANEVFQDRIDIEIQLVVPAPLNYITVKLIV